MISLRCRDGMLRVEGLMDMRGRGAIDQQAEQFGATVVTTGIHLRLALIDQREIKVADHHALAGTQWLTQQFA